MRQRVLLVALLAVALLACSPTPTDTPPTVRSTALPTHTVAPTETETPVPSATNAPTRALTLASTPAFSVTPTDTSIPTLIRTATPTLTLTPTATLAATGTPTPTRTATRATRTYTPIVPTATRPTATMPPATTAPTLAPSPRPTVVALFVQIVSVTSPVRPGANATLNARTLPGSACDIIVYYKSGPSEAAGLFPKNADAQGNVSWTWKVGTRTTPGNWRIVITARSGGKMAAAEVYFTVAK